MKLKKLPSLLVAAAAFATGSAVSSAQETVIFTGNDLEYHFGGTGTTGAITTSDFTTGPSALSVNFAANYHNYVFSGTDTGQRLATGTVDWITDSISFDYKTSSVSNLLRFRLYVSAPGDQNIFLQEWSGNGLALVTDGQWHTVTLTGVDWTSTYYNLVGNSSINPANPMAVKIGFQSGGLTSTGNILFDNIRIGSPEAIPEPASFALLASLGAGMMAVTRRRRRA